MGDAHRKNGVVEMEALPLFLLTQSPIATLNTLIKLKLTKNKKLMTNYYAHSE